MPLKKPIWHKRLEDIDVKHQPDQLDEKYVDNGFHIYKSSWDDLKTVLNPHFAKICAGTDLYSKYQDKDKLDKIVTNWNSGVALIPPMLMHLSDNTLIPADGKHRMKVAFISDPAEIYFILFDIDLPSINNYFKPELVE
ncbi:hypothetical protein BC749_108260 [Flavobacterium araucananum]|uniref:hypothetical protein n=1 Tax=Flavobacterium araucananum TaxID=946678 RepID=UPI000D6D3866|nr:hypothetical protein [Flavobacterium araucananum]PWJ97109.1 hypothetical protein BC749_108260 [Flavobacterium araucananum]